MANTYRRTIRIDGKVINSPRFERKSDADAWYDKMKRQKQFATFGFQADLRKSEVPTFMEYATEWLQKRIEIHPANTWRNDERRLRHHILPIIGDLPMNRIGENEIRKLLNEMTVLKTAKGGTQSKAKPAHGTVKLAKSLLSAIFQSALEETRPLVQYNPVRNIRKLSNVRQATGPKLPTRILENDEACIRFLEAAAGMVGLAPHAVVVNGRALAYAALLVMTGCRVSEAMALRWQDIRFKERNVLFAWVYERESKSIKERTKKGEFTSRDVPLADELAAILAEWKKKSPYHSPDDFVLSRSGGGHMNTSTVRQMHNRIAKRAKADVSPHGLRHTFAVRFAINNGNMPALKELLGHSSITTTEIYGKVRAQHLSAFRHDLNVGFGVAGKNERHHSDTKKTTTPVKPK